MRDESDILGDDGDLMGVLARRPSCAGSDPHWQVHRDDAVRFMRSLPERSVDLVLTDPPYDSLTHERARTNGSGDKLVDQGFSPIVFPQLQQIVEEAGRVTRRWVVMTCEYKMAVLLELAPPPGVVFLRHGVWVKDSPMPQLTADRPGMGWEAVVFLHRADERPRWNGGGRSGVFRHPVVRGGLPTEKPVSLGEELVALFADPSGVVLDPFCGSGAFLEAAQLVGCRALGVDVDADRVERSARRLAQRVLLLPVQLRQETLPNLA